MNFREVVPSITKIYLKYFSKCFEILSFTTWYEDPLENIGETHPLICSHKS